LLLLKHIFDERLAERLPGILILLQQLTRQKTGLEFLETLLRYVSVATDKVSNTQLIYAVEAVFTDVGDEMMPTIASKWIEQGLEQGLEQATRQDILEIVEVRFGYVPEEVETAVTSITHLPTLRSLLRLAITVESLEAFQEQLDALNF
jgi:hypothetical protein